MNTSYRVPTTKRILIEPAEMPVFVLCPKQARSTFQFCQPWHNIVGFEAIGG
jgi:hypothetical protein